MSLALPNSLRVANLAAMHRWVILAAWWPTGLEAGGRRNKISRWRKILPWIQISAKMHGRMITQLTESLDSSTYGAHETACDQGIKQRIASAKNPIHAFLSSRQVRRIPMKNNQPRALIRFPYKYQ